MSTIKSEDIMKAVFARVDAVPFAPVLDISAPYFGPDGALALDITYADYRTLTIIRHRVMFSGTVQVGDAQRLHQDASEQE